MRIWTLSDLHVGHDAWHPPDPPEHDVLVVAGDTENGLCRRSLPWLARNLARGQPVIYVPGNHDFYRCRLQPELVQARDLAADLGITLLAEGESVVIQGTRFVGATLWTDYEIRPGRSVQARQDARFGMNDHRTIENWHTGSYNRFTPGAAYHIHREHRARIEAALATPHDGPTVVVTHHAPHERSLRFGEWTELLDGAYASDLSGILEGPHAPALWLHGHVHVSRDYRVGGTRVVSNPRGYLEGLPRRPENPAFDATLVLEV